MTLIATNTFSPLSVGQWLSVEVIDIFDIAWSKIIELHPHSSLTYLIIWLHEDIDVRIVTTWSSCSCKIFGLFYSDTDHPVSGSLKVSLNDSDTSADVHLISFLYDGAKASLDGSIDIANHLDHVYGRLLEENIILGKDISLTTIPKLNISSYDVTASHGANVDTFDQQKLFYMMSRGLTKQQSQNLLVAWSIDHVLSHFQELSEPDILAIYQRFSHGASLRHLSR